MQTRRLQQHRAFLVWVLFWVSASACASPGKFEITNIEPHWEDGIYQIDAQVSYQLSPESFEALQSGVALVFRVDIVIERTKKYWLDENIAVLKQQYQLQYHALSDQYVLQNLNSGASHNFPTLQGALAVMGNIIALPVMDAQLLDKSFSYTGRLRARLEVEALPTPLRLLAYIKSGWRLETDWRQWNVTLDDD